MFLTKRGFATAALAFVRAQPVVAASVRAVVAPLVSASEAAATRSRRRRMPAPYPGQPPSSLAPLPPPSGAPLDPEPPSSLPPLDASGVLTLGDATPGL